MTKVMKQAKRPVTKSGYKLTPTQRYKIGRKGAEIGVTAAIRYYKNKFPDLSLTEPTVRRLKNLYLKELTTDHTLKSKFHQNTQRMHACLVYKNAQRKGALNVSTIIYFYRRTKTDPICQSFARQTFLNAWFVKFCQTFHRQSFAPYSNALQN